MALRLASHAYVLDVGRVRLAGTSAWLSGSDEVRRLYLGAAADDVPDAAPAADERPDLRRWVP